MISPFFRFPVHHNKLFILDSMKLQPLFRFPSILITAGSDNGMNLSSGNRIIEGAILSNDWFRVPLSVNSQALRIGSQSRPARDSVLQPARELMPL